MKQSLGLLLLLVANLSNAQFIEHEDRDRRHLVPNSPDTTTPHKVGLFTHMAEVGPTCKVARSSVPVPLPRVARDLSSVKYDAIFSYTLKEHVDKNSVLGLTVVHDGKIVDQHFRFERRETDQYTSFSMAKSLISIMIGIALDEGLIKSLDDPASSYTHRINESSYGKISIRSLLRMSSGVPFDGGNTGKTDNYYFDQALRFSPTSSVIKVLNDAQRSSSNVGKKFNYANIETTVLAEVLRGATGKSICQYMQEKLWEPIGAEYDATWATDSLGNELGYAFFNATQFDFAKVAVMLANQGVINGKRIVSADYVDQATNIERQAEGFKFNQAQMGTGYGYQFWLREKPGRYFMQGAYGQYIGIDRDTKTILIINSSDNNEANSIRSVRTYRLLGALVNNMNLSTK